MSKTKSHIQNQGLALKNLENQVRQLANALSSRLSGSLPNNTEIPKSDGKEYAKAITLRSGNAIKILVEKDDKQSMNKTKDKVPEKEI